MQKGKVPRDKQVPQVPRAVWLKLLANNSLSLNPCDTRGTRDTRPTFSK